jgi:hypothetical protein
MKPRRRLYACNNSLTARSRLFASCLFGYFGLLAVNLNLGPPYFIISLSNLF